MKIRIKGNSIRLRLTQSEVKLFKDNGLVDETTNFPGGKSFHYSIRHSDEISEIEATFDKGKAAIIIPLDNALYWFGDEQISMGKDIDLVGGEVLSILIEKDFQCLKPRIGEDETDNYPNPLSEDL